MGHYWHLLSLDQTAADHSLWGFCQDVGKERRKLRESGRTCVCISIHLQVFFMCAHMYACLWLCEVSVHSCGCYRHRLCACVHCHAPPWYRHTHGIWKSDITPRWLTGQVVPLSIVRTSVISEHLTHACVRLHWTAVCMHFSVWYTRYTLMLHIHIE